MSGGVDALAGAGLRGGVTPRWRYGELLWQLVAREVQQRYRGSYFGVLWSAATPLLMLAVYTFVFAIVFRARWGATSLPENPMEFALTLFAGILPFSVFSEVVGRAPHVIVSVPNYVKKVVFPLEILPVVAVGSALVQSFVSLAILLAATLAAHGGLPASLVYLPLAYLPLVLLCLGLAWLLASLGVYVRDLGHAVGVAVQVLFFMSPVFYPVTAVPEPLRPLLYTNPLTTILSSFRRTILWGDPPAWGPWLGCTIGAAALAVLGYWWFMRTRQGFADVM